MSVIIEQELKKLTAKFVLPEDENGNRVKPTDIVEWTKTLLKDAEGEDVVYLTKRGFQHLESKSKIERTQSDISEQYHKIMGADPYSLSYNWEAIRHIALTYGLRFLPVKHYNGELPSDIVQKMKEFESTKVKSTLDPISLREFVPTIEYYILAPKEYFKLQERPRVVSRDPLLFAYVRHASSESNGTFLVHKWGEEHMTSLRKLPYLFWESSKKFVFMRVLPVILLGYAITLSCVFNLKHETTESIVGGIFVGTAMTALICAVIASVFSDVRRNYVENWDSPYRR